MLTADGYMAIDKFELSPSTIYQLNNKIVNKNKIIIICLQPSKTQRKKIINILIEDNFLLFYRYYYPPVLRISFL